MGDGTYHGTDGKLLYSLGYIINKFRKKINSKKAKYKIFKKMREEVAVTD